MNANQNVHSGPAVEPLTRDRFIDLAQPGFTKRQAKIVYKLIVEHVIRWDDASLDVYCTKCLARYGDRSCTHVSLDIRSLKPAPVMEIKSLIGFVDGINVYDILRIGPKRAALIHQVVGALRG